MTNTILIYKGVGIFAKSETLCFMFNLLFCGRLREKIIVQFDDDQSVSLLATNDFCIFSLYQII